MRLNRSYYRLRSSDGRGFEIERNFLHPRFEAYAGGELKHGTLALIEEGVPVIALATQEDVL